MSQSTSLLFVMSSVRLHSFVRFYFHAFLAVQLFAERHPEFDFFWNWEMDARYTGLYNDLFPSLATWAARQPQSGLWERNLRFYLPSVHGTYDQFRKATSLGHTPAGRPSPWIDQSLWPEPAYLRDDADLITLFPMFDTSYTLWPWKDYLIKYRLAQAVPRFATVGTNVRLSRRLVDLMATENKAGRGMMSEMWPPTLAYHHHLKAVYVPHPIFLDRDVPADTLQALYNGGRKGSLGGSWNSVINDEWAFLGSTWYWNAQFALQVYKGWIAGSLKQAKAQEVMVILSSASSTY